LQPLYNEEVEAYPVDEHDVYKEGLEDEQHDQLGPSLLRPVVGRQQDGLEELRGDRATSADIAVDLP
jgi:hypothetical protein